MLKTSFFISSERIKRIKRIGHCSGTKDCRHVRYNGACRHVLF